MNDKFMSAKIGFVAALPIFILSTYILSLPSEIRNDHFSFMVIAPLCIASLPWGFAIALIMPLFNNYFPENILENSMFAGLMLSIFANCYWIARTSTWRKTRLILFTIIFSLPLIGFLDHLHKF